MGFVALGGNELERFKFRFFTNNTLFIADIEYDNRCFNIA